MIKKKEIGVFDNFFTVAIRNFFQRRQQKKIDLEMSFVHEGEKPKTNPPTIRKINERKKKRCKFKKKRQQS